MSEQALDAHLERWEQKQEEMVEVEKGYLEWLEAKVAQLEGENEELKFLLYVNVVMGRLDANGNKILTCRRCQSTKRVGSSFPIEHHPDCREGKALEAGGE